MMERKIEVVIYWVPGHIFIERNKRADKATK